MRGSMLVRRLWLVVVAVVVVAGAVPSMTTAAAGAAQNGKLAATAISSDTGSDIWVMDADGTNAVNLTSSWQTEGYPSWERAPDWSPDGTQLAFTSTRGHVDGSGTGPGVWVMNADGSSPREVYGSGSVAYPSWSPDGQWILFALYPADVNDNDALYKIRPDGTGLTLVLEAAPDEDEFLSASWSPDGSLIVFTIRGRLAYDVPRLFTVKPDGTGRQELLSTATQLKDPSWSPDSGRIAYSGIPNGNLGQPFEVRSIARDGTDDSAWIDDAVNPIWSPDGTALLFSRRIGFVWHLYSTPVASGPITDVPIPFIDSVTIFDPDWDWQSIPLPAGDPVVGLVDPSQGLWHLYNDSGQQAAQFFFGNPGDYPIVGDWDCDGVETPGMYRQSDGYVYLRNSNTQGAADIRFFFGDPGDVPIAGDFNNDGCDTVSIYRPSNQTFFIINALGANDGGLGAAEFSYVFGDPGDKPFVGDFDGNGSETVGLHRESTGLVYFRNSHTQGNADAQFIFGDPGDRLIAGDWNNNGAYSPALYRPGNTTFYFRYTNTQGNADNQFVPVPNGTGWLPVAGDFGE